MGGIWEHVTIPGLGFAFTLLSAILVFAYKFGRQDKILEELGTELDEVHTLIETFHGKCDIANSAIERAVTLSMLKEHCKESQTNCTDNVCRKIGELKTGQTLVVSKLDSFMREHNKTLIRDEKLFATLVAQMASTQKQLETVTTIQREVIQEVSILKKGRVR